MLWTATRGSLALARSMLTGGESLVVAPWPTAAGGEHDAGAAQRIDAVRKLVTEIRRFPSDQGLNRSRGRDGYNTRTSRADTSQQRGRSRDGSWDGGHGLLV